MPLPKRTLGQDGPSVPAIGLGLGSLGGFYGPAGTLDEKVGVLERAHSAGVRFWDTADVYADSEEVIGEWVRRAASGNNTTTGKDSSSTTGNGSKREDVFLATKFALQRQPDGRHSFRSDPEYVMAACENSLRRLGVDCIDLLYCHRVDGVTPIEKTVEAMVELKKQGKIRHLGLSEVSASTLRRAHAAHPISALQMEYSLFTLDIESPGSGILQTCRELGVTVVAYSPVGRGVLTGRFQSHADIPAGDLRRMLPKYSEENFPQVMQLVRGLEDAASAHGCTPAQVALAWLLAQGPDIVPIPGTKSGAKVDENAAAARIRLSEEEVQEIRALAERVDIKGTRYPAA
ncbi:reductase [Aspergillus sp. HF37]|nr:reductase [Aspergillus sp. HF37]